jgi:DNA-directed RNA polymerase II subunit RPB1
MKTIYNMLRSDNLFTEDTPEISSVSKVSFGVLRPDEIEHLSVAEITHTSIYDSTGQPRVGGIHDPHMGSLEMSKPCLTCNNKINSCPGHFGHIKLAKPVYHLGYLKQILRVLRSVCFRCSKLKIEQTDPRFKQINKIRDPKARGVALSKICASVKKCRNDPIKRNKNSEGSEERYAGCGATQPKVSKEGTKLMVKFPHQKGQNELPVRDLFADEALGILKGISDLSCQALGLNPASSRPEWMIIQVLPVAPPCVRPYVVVDSAKSEDDLTHQYTQILKSNIKLKSLMDRGAAQHLINQETHLLQFLIATLFNNNLAGLPQSRHRSGKPIKSFSQRIKGKEGRLRGNLMGKRVDFSARSVITPDPSLSLSQVGVPKSIAMNLTVPEEVCAYNIHKLRQLIQNGPKFYPGAKYIFRPDGDAIDLRFARKGADYYLEYGYKVERHLCDDDLVIFNRQPSLHKMSMMAHSVKVLPYSTFRLNLSVTTPYNADFDGDEMNLHVPQTLDAKAELKELMLVSKQIVSPQSNKPIMGLVQDALLGVSLLTRRDSFLEVQDVMNLLMWVDNFDGRILKPAILKPKPLWTGKQVFSMLLPNVNLKRFANFHDPSKNNATLIDSEVIIEEGKLLTGIVDKRTVGASSGSLIHVICMDLGPQAAADFLTRSQKVINSWLLTHGFSVGISDTIADESTRSVINSILYKANNRITDLIKSAHLGKIPCQSGRSMRDSFEYLVNTKLNSARDKAGRHSILNLSVRNGIKAMVNAGSKGSEINICQIMACVGQQNIEGKRIPFLFHNRTLPHYKKDDLRPESCGFVKSSYISGLSPSEFFFHAMGGREGISDTAVKTSETGYIQRRLMKTLEDVIVHYDGSVRNSSGNIIQFVYGEDGLAGEFIEDQKLETLNMNFDILWRKYQFIDSKNVKASVEVYKNVMSEDMIRDIVSCKETQDRCMKEFQTIFKDQGEIRKIFRGFDDKQHLPVNVRRIIWNAKRKFGISDNSTTDLHPLDVIQLVEALIERLNSNTRHSLSDSEGLILFYIHLRSLLASKRVILKERLTLEALEWVLNEIETRFNISKVHPGEAVGSIAAQSISEPATQMTLNTFHFAGVSSKNVTLGVPRLIELLNVHKKIKSGSLTIYLSPSLPQTSSNLKELISQLEFTSLRHLSESFNIYYDPDPVSTIIPEDLELINSYLELPEEDLDSKIDKMSPWLIRIELNKSSVLEKGLNMQDISNRIFEEYGESLHCICSDDNDEKLVIRLREVHCDIYRPAADSMSICKKLKELEEKLLDNIWIQGVIGIHKVVMRQVSATKIDNIGNLKREKEWILETDGCNLAAVLATRGVDHTRTVSNDINQTFEVLGIEAARNSLMRELRDVLSGYGIYINYRHLALLCDVMTCRGYLMSITRHGLNKTECGPLHKASFEQSVDVLMDSASYSEIDNMRGVTQNIILGNTMPVGTGMIDILMSPSRIIDLTPVETLDHSRPKLVSSNRTIKKSLPNPTSAISSFSCSLSKFSPQVPFPSVNPIPLRSSSSHRKPRRPSKKNYKKVRIIDSDDD